MMHRRLRFVVSDRMSYPVVLCQAHRWLFTGLIMRETERSIILYLFFKTTHTLSTHSLSYTVREIFGNQDGPMRAKIPLYLWPCQEYGILNLYMPESVTSGRERGDHNRRPAQPRLSVCMCSASSSFNAPASNHRLGLRRTTTPLVASH